MTGTSRGRVALLLAVTFVAGMAAGVAADRSLAVDGPSEATKQARDDHRRDRRGGRTTIERFADELGLTADQRSRIDPILEDAREGMSELFEPVRPAYRDLVDSTRARIEAVLTPGQVAEYRRLLERDYGDLYERRDRADETEAAEADGTEEDTENR